MPGSTLSLATFEPVIVPYEPRPDGLEVWDCMDERRPHAADTVLGRDLYYQTPAGVLGIALDWAVAMEAFRTGSFTNKNQQVHRLAAAVHEELRREGIYAVLHEACAAEGSVAEIASSTVKSGEDETVLASSRLFNPRITSSQFENSAVITGNLQAGEYIAEAGVAHQHLRKGTVEHPAIPSARLKEVPHDSLGYVALWEPGMCFDVWEADGQDKRAYVVAMGGLERLHRVLNRQYPARLEDFRAASSTRVANIQSHHLLGPDGLPLPIFNDFEKAV